MGSAVVGSLRVVLSMETADFEQAAVRVSRQSDSWAKSLGTLGKQATDVGRTLTTSLTLPLVGLAGLSAKAAIDFESSFAGVRKTVEATEDQFAELAQGMRDLSKQIPVNVNELNRIGEAAGQLGIKTENIIGFTEVMAKLGVATNMSSDQAATALARLANITQMPQTQFANLGASVVALGNNFATTESEIVEFGLRIAGAGSLAKMSEGDILAIGTALSSVGVEAEAGGTAVQKVILEMIASVEQGGENLNTFAATAGMTADQFRQGWEQDAAGAFAAFVEGLGRQGTSAITTLDNLGMSDVRLQRSFLALAGSGDTLTRSIRLGNDAFKDASALNIEAAQRFGTTASQLTLLKNRANDVAITGGQALLPVLSKMVDMASSLIPLVESLVRGFTALPTPIQNTALGFLAVAAAAGPALWAFGSMATGASTLIGAFGKKGLAMKALTPLITGVGKAFTSLVGVFSGGGTVVTILARAFTALSGPVGWIIGSVAGILTVTSTWDELWRILKATGEIIRNVVIGSFEMLLDLGRRFQSWSADLIRAAISVTGLTDVFQVMGRVIGSVVSTVGGWLGKLGGWFADSMGWIADWTEGIAAATTSTSRLLPEVASPFNHAADAAAEFASSVGKIEPAMLRNLAAQDAFKLSMDDLVFRMNNMRSTGATAAEILEALGAEASAAGGQAKQLGLDISSVPPSVAALSESFRQSKRAALDAAAGSEAKKKADEALKKAAEEAQAAVDAQTQALRSLGLITQQDVISRIQSLQGAMSAAARQGAQPLSLAVDIVIRELVELRTKALAAGLSVEMIDDHLTALRRTVSESRAPIPTLNAQMVATIPNAVRVGGAMQTITRDMLVQRNEAHLLAGAYSTLGIQSQASLAKVAQAAREAYATAAAAGWESAAQQQAARQAVLDAEIAAGERTVGLWETQIQPAIEGAWNNITGSLATNFTDMLTGATGFKDGFLNIWNDVKSSVRGILDTMLQTFLNEFLGGMLEGLSGWARQAGSIFGQVFGMGSAGMGSLPGVGAGAGSGAGAGAGLGAGLATAGLGVAAGAAAWTLGTMATEWTKAFFGDHFIDGAVLDRQNAIEAAEYTGAAARAGMTPEEFIDSGGVPGFKGGGWGDFGDGTPAVLHGTEAVFPLPSGFDLAKHLDALEAPAGHGGGGMATFVFEMDKRTVGRVFAPVLIDEVQRLQLSR